MQLLRHSSMLATCRPHAARNGRTSKSAEHAFGTAKRAVAGTKLRALAHWWARGRFATRGRKTGGRKKGTPNKRTSVLAANAEAAAAGASGEEPIDYMLRIMRDPTVEPARRDVMARAAAPYRHPQLQAVAHKHMNADGTPIAPTINLTISAPPEPKPKLLPTGPKDGETVQ